MENERVVRLERNVRLLSLYATVLTLALTVLGLSAFRGSQRQNIVRTRGIVIEDEKGRERILIGAPIPFAKNRVRTDIARVQKEWAPRFPDSAKYMGYYKNYRHSMHGMLILNEAGHDRLAIGDSTPDPNIGRRIGPATGIELNDANGFERGGYGVLTVKGTDRIVLGLDSRQGREGIALVLDDNGNVQVMVREGEQSMLLGTLSPADQGREGAQKDFGIVVRDGKEFKHRLVTRQP